jgi:hypothetical protein
MDLHVEELDIIQHTQDSRIQALFAQLAFHAAPVQAQDGNLHSCCQCCDEYFKPLVEGAYSKSFLGCIHCGTLLHSGGKVQCLWKKISKKKASKLKANAALLQPAEDQGTPSDDNK